MAARVRSPPCTENCIVPTNTGRPSSPWAISSPVSRRIDAVGPVQPLRDHRAEKPLRTKARSISLQTCMKTVLDHRKRDRIERLGGFIVLRSDRRRHTTHDQVADARRPRRGDASFDHRRGSRVARRWRVHRIARARLAAARAHRPASRLPAARLEPHRRGSFDFDRGRSVGFGFDLAMAQQRRQVDALAPADHRGVEIDQHRPQFPAARTSKRLPIGGSENSVAQRPDRDATVDSIGDRRG